MRIFRPLFALMLALAGAASVSAANAPSFSPDRFRAHVAFLADDRLEGRDTGSRGYDIAATYVATQFMALGLRPGGENGGWFQQVPFRSALLTGTPSVTITGPAGTRTWQNGTDVIVRASLTEAEQDVSAPVVFVGYGLDAPKLGLDDYKGIDVRGKIVAVLDGTPANLPSEIAAFLGDEKRAMAARRGAIGFVQIPTTFSAGMRPWPSMTSYAARPSLTWLDPKGKPKDDAPGLRTGATLNTPAADMLFAGARRTYAAVKAEAERTGARPKGFPLKTSMRIQRSTAWTTITSPEVIGILPGSDPKLREEYVILMAHLDHLGLKRDAKPGEDNVYNGALDNAAGIATMLEAARAFVESGRAPKRSVMFIANTAEEKGLLGADYFAQNPTVPIEKITAVVGLDMPLLLYDFKDVIAFGADHSTVAQSVAKAAGQLGIALSPDPMPEENIFVRSDHYMFVRQGVPAILLATGFANGGGEQWRSFLGGTYHHVDDDLKQPINWAAGARYAEVNYLISRDLADIEQRPRWYKGDFFGDLFAPGTPRAVRENAAAGSARN